MRTRHPVCACAGEALVYDSLRITIEQRIDNDGIYFQCSLEQDGAVEFGGSFRRQETFRVADVQDLRRAYEQELRMLRELTAAGVPVPPLDLQRLIDLGRRVAAVLPQTARQGIVRAFQRAQRERRGLRITLEVSADDEAKQLLAIPWELMVLPIRRGTEVDAGGEGFLLLNADVSLVRQVQGVGRNATPRLARPLRLQALAALPVDGEPIDVAATRKALEAVLPDEALDQFWYDGRDTLRALQQRIRKADPQIVHLLCHGELSDTGRGFRSDLLFAHGDGYTQRVSAFDLAPALTQATDLQLIVLQACDAGATPPAAPTRPPDSENSMETERLAVENIALALVRPGVPAVVAMQGAVRQDAAGAFVQECYDILRQGGSIEAAISRGRIAMQVVGGPVDWSLPVVYQGSGLPDQSTPLTRLADAVIDDPAIRRSVRAGAVVLALALLIVGVLRWLAHPPSSLPTLDGLILPLQAWALSGLVGPAIVAACCRGVRNRGDLPIAVRRAAMWSQWMGAYLGYAMGGLLGVALLLPFWVVGLLEATPLPIRLALLGLVPSSALFLSYAVARSQVRSALALAQFNPELFSWRIGMGMLVWLVITTSPIGILFLPGTPIAFLLEPGPAALACTGTLISLVLAN